jgi:hypothetical protein
MAGVASASLAGGAEIMFYGSGMSHMPSDLNPIFTASALNFQSLGPALTRKYQISTNYNILFNCESLIPQLTLNDRI